MKVSFHANDLFIIHPYNEENPLALQEARGSFFVPQLPSRAVGDIYCDIVKSQISVYLRD